MVLLRLEHDPEKSLAGWTPTVRKRSCFSNTPRERDDDRNGIMPLQISLSSLPLFLAPLQELAEQGLAVRRALRRARSGLIQERLKIATDLFLVGGGAAEALEHLLGNRMPGPTRNGRSHVDVAPLGMAGRDLEPVPLGEQLLDEALDASVTIASLLPIEDGENRRHRDRVDLLSFGDEGGIVLRIQLAQGVIVGERLGERNRNDMQAGVLGDPGQEIDRLADHAHQGGNLPGSQLLQGALLVDRDLLDLHAQALENNRSGQARS